MSPATNWLSFSLSPAEMLRSSDQPQLENFDSFYSNEWGSNSKPELFYPEGDDDQLRHGGQAPGIGDSPIPASFLHPQSAPKLEDFFSGESMVQYSDSQTETQDSSSLTHIYDHQSSGFISDQQIARFQAFSANSGSEVEDSASIAMTHLADFAAHSIDSSPAANELGFGNSPAGALSLGVAQNQTHQAPLNQHNPIVAAQADSDCTKIIDTFGQRTSIYRGVTRHRWTGRYEAHLWDNSCRREGQARKGRQVYLGGYDKEEKAARAYDLAALKYWGPTATTNFPVSHYNNEIEAMKNATKQEFIASLRRKSSGFSRGASKYRGVTRHHQQGRWQARIGRVAGNKDLYLGTFPTEEEAAEAYDIAAIKFRGINAVTNFEMSRYDVEAISNNTLPIGGAAKRLKLSLEPEPKPCNNISFASIQPAPAPGVNFDAVTVAPHFYHHNVGLTFPSPSPAGSMAMMNQSGEFFVWPHQSYG